MAPASQHENRSFALKRADGRAVRVQIVPATTQHLGFHETAWKPQLRDTHALDADWNWLADFLEVELPSEARETYALVVEGISTPEALMSIEFQLDTVYVDRLAVAPANRTSDSRLKGCGTALIMLAIERSASRGFEGRLWLHSLEDPDTVRFYGGRLGMLEVRRDVVDGSKMRRFEMSEAVAKRLVGGAA